MYAPIISSDSNPEWSHTGDQIQLAFHDNVDFQYSVQGNAKWVGYIVKDLGLY
ncbi:hypothetical protein [Mycoplasma sp. SG1]|uniref:hypothetical protein n=1 Tax=Mycoplasma sp. SG1 TaxID=2810348 RepID=UPI002025AF9A|nr:hypothetical protein [Mycoplasma sp. SG1]URM53034.1 hypothetical protein JRW51_01665 [Mycoplasma sp. SG1]